MTYMPKPQALAEAPAVLNRPDVPWQYSVQGDGVVGYWKWMDPGFFDPRSVTQEIREYSFTCTLLDDGTWKESDHVVQRETGVSFGSDGITFGKSTSSSRGSVRMKVYALGPGGFRTEFDTDMVKAPLRAYLAQRGWTKKKGFLGRLFG